MATGGCADVTASNSENIGYVVQNVYRDLIIKHVRCGSFIGRMGIADEHQEVKEKITALENWHRQSEASKEFLDYLKTNGEPRDYSLLVQILEEDGYNYVAKLLRGDDTIDPDIHKEHCRLVQFFCNDITEKMDFRVMYPKLVEGDWMDTEDSQLLKRLAENNGNISATKWLISVVLPRRKENWFKQFLQLLWDLDYRDLVLHIHEGFSPEAPQTENQMDLEISTDENMEADDSNENAICVSASGAAYECEGDYDAPRQPEISFVEQQPSAVLKRSEDIRNISHKNIKLQKLGHKRVTEWVMLQKPTIRLPTDEFPDDSSVESSIEDNTLLQEFEEMNVNVTPDLLKVRELAKPLENRLYQEELVRAAADGSNVIIIAPTGCGKTVVAFKIIQEHLLRLEASGKKSKIAFFANEVTLVHQQHDGCVAHLDSKVKAMVLVGETKYKTSLTTEEIIQKKDILFMTPQVIVDALASKKLKSLSVFTMIIFDECHHVRDKHPTNQIMSHYMEMKHSRDTNVSLPQILGLTASVGVGNSRDKERARKHIKILCANMDATGGLVTVREHKESLAQHANNVATAIKMSPERATDPFRECIERIMDKIEQKLAEYHDHPDLEHIPKIDKEITQNLARGSPRYTQWLGKLYNALFIRIKKDELRRICLTCVEYLSMYNKALIINADCRACDGMTVLKTRSMLLLPHQQAQIEIDERLHQLYLDSLPQLLKESNPGVNLNPKLIVLQLEILDQMKKKPTSRVLILVQTRDLARSLLRWMYEDQQLKLLSPVVVTGCGASSDKGGMTRTQQLEAVRSFKWGSSRAAVATSVAEEGMDVASCSLVIRYEYVSNEIGMIQARGRASRVKDGSYTTITSNHELASKEEDNKHFEVVMDEAVLDLQEEFTSNPGIFRQQLLDFQQSEIMTRKNEKAKADGICCDHKVYQLHCFTCSVSAFSSTQIRTVADSHRLVMSPNIWQLTKETEANKIESFDGMKKIKSVECKVCKRSWGSGVMYKDVKFLCMSIKSFFFRDIRNGFHHTPRRWAETKTMFQCQPMTDDDIKHYKAELNN